MDACHTRNDCDNCPGRVVCHCLQITEEMLLEALDTFNPRTVKDVRLYTGAGDGCTACHKRLRKYLDREAVGLPVVQSSSA